MKKIPLFILSILVLGLATTQSSHAAILENDTTWWTVEELLAFYPEVEAEKEAKCGSDLDCKMEFGFLMMERGEKYSALNNLLESQFWVTSINPETETIKVLFFDDDMMLKRMGIEEKLELENLYIGWTESWLGHGYYHNFEAPFNNTILGVHQLFNSEVEDIGVITPWQESEFSMLDLDISGNTNGFLNYTIYAKNNMFNAQGDINYSSCLNSPDYREGMECKMYISGSRWVSFFPPRTQIVEQGPVVTLAAPDDDRGSIEPTTQANEANSTDNPDSPSELNESLKPSNTNTDNDPEEFNNPIAQNEIIESLDNTKETNSNTIALGYSKIIQPRAPETGQGKITSNNSIEMPWWIILINAIGLLLAVWWLVPSKTQKSRKKYKKTIDKKRILR